jgi:hypothetical protein
MAKMKEAFAGLLIQIGMAMASSSLYSMAAMIYHISAETEVMVVVGLMWQGLFDPYHLISLTYSEDSIIFSILIPQITFRHLNNCDICPSSRFIVSQAMPVLRSSPSGILPFQVQVRRQELSLASRGTLQVV